jgi:Cu+-exporting ATPase
MAGTTLVSGNIKMIVEKKGNETALAAIIEMVKNAQADKPPIQRIGDKVSAVFVPAVLLIAAITFLVSAFVFSVPFSESFLRSIAVLVISCPCAMGLATPTALAVGLGRAAKNGILIKSATVLENLEGIKSFVFDKTGTLTTGDFSLKEFRTFDFDESLAKEIVLSMEEHSSHPLAKSLVKIFSAEIKKRTVMLVSAKEQKGEGIHGVDSKGNHYFAGSLASMKNKNVPAGFSVYLSMNDKIIAAVSLKDELRKNAAELIARLKIKKISTVLLSGDSHERCKEVAEALGIKEIYSEKLPAEKLEVIDHLKKKGKVAMMGDGINDAPALVKADAAFSFSYATQAAINSAEVVLLNKNDLKEVSHAMNIGRHTMITIKQNLFWAFAYNVVAIPIAAAGFLSPIIGALSMAFSDVVVIGNSVRLRYKRILET